MSKMGFKLFIQATGCCRTYLPRPPPLPDPTTVQHTQTPQVLLPPVVCVFLLWLVSDDHTPVLLQLTGILLVVSLGGIWSRYCLAWFGQQLDKYAIPRARYELDLPSLEPSRVPTAYDLSCLNERLIHGFSTMVILTPHISVVLCMLILQSVSLFIGASVSFHLKFALGGQEADALAHVAHRLWYPCALFFREIIFSRRARIELYRFFRFDILAAWRETGDTLARLQQDLDRLLSHTDDTPTHSDWIESCDEMHDPTRDDSDTASPLAPNHNHSVDTSFYSPPTTSTSSITKAPWRYRRWLRRVLRKANRLHDSPNIPLFVEESNTPSPTESVTPFPTPLNRLTAFLRAFNPASAGISILDAERYSQIHLPPPPSDDATSQSDSSQSQLNESHSPDDDPAIEHTSVHLKNCAKTMLARMRSNQVLPKYFANVHEVIGSIYQAVTNPNSTPLIVDTGASCCITPHKHDFVEGTYKDSEVQIKDLSGLNKVAGRGLIRWRVRDKLGRVQTIEIEGYHMPKTSVRLLSPQSVIKTLGGSGDINHLRFVLFLPGDVTLVAPYNLANLPILPLVDSVSTTAGLWNECFGFNSEMRDAWARGTLDAKNQNLTSAQKEILLWHQRLSHVNLAAIHNLARQKSQTKKVSTTDELVALRDGPLLPCTYNVPNAVCDNLICAACAISKATRRKPSIRSSSAPSREKILKENDLQPGDCISCDHYVSPVPGRVIAQSGHSSTKNGYVGGTIYVDHASGFVFHRAQRNLTAAETIRGKLLLEQEACNVGVSIRKYHSDNGVFSSKEFKEHCKSLKQKLTFSGVGAKFQNGVAERSILTVCNMARSNIIHATLHYPQHKFIGLWAFAMSYAIWCYNKVPPGGYGMSPEEIWSSTKTPRSGLPRAHVFGCPVYVLDPALQDGGKIPKWNSRARQGIFVGFSPYHSSTVPLVFNPTTQHISPQYHVIFDDAFTTVPSLTTPEERDDLWADLFHSSREKYIDELDPAATDIAENSLLDTEWRDNGVEDGVETSRGKSVSDLDGDSEGAVDGDSEGAVDGVSEGAVDGDSEGAVDGASQGDVEGHTEGETVGQPVGESIGSPVDATQGVSEGAPPPPLHQNEQRPPQPSSPPLTRSKRRAITQHWRSSLLATFLTIPCYALQSIHECTQPPALAANIGSTNGALHTQKRLRRTYLTELALGQDDWSDVAESVDSGVSLFANYLKPDLSDEVGSYTITDVQPHLLKAKAATHDADNPTYTQAMNSPEQDKWYESMVVEYETLLKIKAWTLVKRTSEMSVLPMTWAFKLKRYPDGLAKKYKARFCVRGDRQVEGVDYFETWAPVVTWTTVRSMMILAANKQLCSAQADITAAFVHAPLDDGNDIYVHQPRGFEVPGNYVLKLNRSVYGIKQAPRNFFKYLKKHLRRQGLHQSDYDPCLFIGSKVIAIVYVDDILFFARKDSDINDVIANLQAQDIQIRREGSAEGFLGVAVEHYNEGGVQKVKLTQTGLTKRVVEALGLCNNYSTKISTPAEAAPLPKDADGDPPSGHFNYGSVVGMLLYLSGHSRPDIAFAVHQCARYTFRPTRRHEKALIRIGRYLKGTIDKGLIMTPTSTPCIDCYPDADFAGLYGHEDVQDPHCVRSRTGFVIMAFGCPVLWHSSLQVEIALSTMEAEYVAVSRACRDLLPVVNIVKQLCKSVGFSTDFASNIHVKIHEDNVGALTLGKMEPRRYTPRSKHYAIKYHWFREHVANKANNIQLVKIDTKNQLGDIFTKGLTQVPFEHLRRLLMGW